MVTITIDHQQIAVDEQLTILEAAKEAHIEIPHLCYLRDINEIGACRVCVVELQGKDKLVTACNTVVQEGMVIYTNSPKVRYARRCNVELLLSQHDCECAYCSRSGNCSLQKISNDLGITSLPYEKKVMYTPWNQSFPLIRESNKDVYKRQIFSYGALLGNSAGGSLGTWIVKLWPIFILLVLVLFLKLLMDWFLDTKYGFLMRIAGDNPQLIATLGKDIGCLLYTSRCV